MKDAYGNCVTCGAPAFRHGGCAEWCERVAEANRAENRRLATNQYTTIDIAPSFPAGDPRHGTTNGYCNLRCRCRPCRDAWADYISGAKERRAERLKADPSAAVHGSATTYSNWRCRCGPCKDAWAADDRDRRRRRAVSR